MSQCAALPGPSLQARPSRQHRQPYARVRQLMGRVGMPQPQLDLLPRRWTRLGCVALIKLPERLRMWSRQVGGAYAHVLGVETVGEIEGVHGELRLPRLRLYHGTRTETEVREHGLRYRLDLAQVMWSPGNMGWRAGASGRGRQDPRIVELYRMEAPPAFILDMFAGIGYFALALAATYPRAKVLAVEKNPRALELLDRNLTLNDLPNVIPWMGDCRQLPPVGDDWSPLPERGVPLIHMGYLGTTADYLPAAFSYVDRRHGTIIFHENYPNDLLGRPRRSQWDSLEPPEVVRRELEAAAELAGCRLKELRAAKVKSYAPGVTHVVARLDLG